MFHRRGTASTALPWLLLIIIVACVVVILPLSPTLVVTFRIVHVPAKAQHLLEVTLQSYSKASLSSVAWIRKGEIRLTQVGSMGFYSVLATVMYGGERLSVGNFTSLGEGTYQIHVVYWPRSEAKNTAYVVSLVLFFVGSQVATATATILPL